MKVFRTGFLVNGVVVATLLVVAAPAFAQKFDLNPTLDTRLTFSDNIRASGTDKRSGWVAEVNPGINGGISREGGRISGRFNATMRNLGYTSEEGWRSPALGLQATGEVEAVEDFFFVNLDAAIQRNNQTSFGGRATDDYLNAARSSETRSLSLAPRLEFGLGSFANAAVRYRQTWLNGGSDSVSRQTNGQLSADINSARDFGPLGWGLSYARTENRYQDSTLRDVSTESYRARLFYTVTPQFRLNASVGRENNDFGFGRAEGSRIVGAGFNWNPGPRTVLSANIEDRFFGNGYDVSFSHRMARSSFQLSAGRDIFSPSQQLGSVYDEQYLGSLFLDPTFRPDLTDPLERLLYVVGLSGDTFVTDTYSINKRLRASYTLTGVRNSLSFSVGRTDRTLISSINGLRPEDVFSTTSNIKSRIASIALNHRLTGRSSLSASLTRTDSESAGPAGLETRRMTSLLSYRTSLGSRSVAGLSYRHTRGSGSSAENDYTENVLTANFGMRF